MAGHRHWRLLITATGGEAYCQLQEIEFALIGQDKHPNGTPSASSNYGGSSAAAAFDGTTSTWLSDGGALPQWVAMDFGSDVEVTVVRLRGNTGSRRLVNFDVQYSDNGVDWTTAWSVAGVPNPAQSWIQLPNPIKPVQMIRLLSTYGDYSSISAIELRTSIGGPTILPSVVDSKSDATTYLGGGYGAWFDGDPNTAQFITSNGWFKTELPIPFGFLTEMMLQRNPSDSRMMTSFKVQKSADGLNWEDHLVVTGLSAWGSGEIRTFDWEPSITDELKRLLRRTSGRRLWLLR